MGMREEERAITDEARTVFNNPKLRIKDVMEWSTGDIKPQAGEVTARLPGCGVNVTIKAEHDKRPKGKK